MNGIAGEDLDELQLVHRGVDGKFYRSHGTDVRQPKLLIPGWLMEFNGRAKTDGLVWWWEEQTPNGVKRHPLIPSSVSAEIEIKK
jgi:hypothetical protein